jgi:hypothetical protein
MLNINANINGARKGLLYPTAGLQVIVYNQPYEEEGTTYLRTSIGVGIPKVSGTGNDTIWDFSVLNDARFDKSNATYWGSTLGDWFYYDTFNPYHGKLKDFKYYELNNQVQSKNQIFAKSSYDSDGYIATDRILVYSEELISSNLNKALIYCNELYEIKLSSLNNISVENERGMNATLKDFSVLDCTQGSYLHQNDGFNMTDPTAIYEFYFEGVINDIAQGTTTLFNNETHGITFQLRSDMGDGGWYMYITDVDGNLDGVDGRSNGDIIVGYNYVKITLNLDTKEITINVNGNITEHTHTNANKILGTVGKYFRVGSIVTKMNPIYFYFKKNDSILNEYIFSELCLDGEYKDGKRRDIIDLVGEKYFNIVGAVNGIDRIKIFTTQSYKNPFRNGYDLYWNQGTLDYLRVSPINSNGISKNPENYKLFQRVTNDKIGYHIFEYIEMPNYDIFDTTNRKYWKISIESDKYYVGNIIGKERWLHKSWLNYNFLNEHIESDYLNYIFPILNKKNAKGQDSVILDFNNIYLYNTDFHSYIRDLSNEIDLGDLMQSKWVSYNRLDYNLFFLLFAQKGNKMVAMRNNYLQFSDDYGKTWNAGIDLDTINNDIDYPISYVHIANNGNIVIFSKRKELYYSNDNLETISPCTLLDINGDLFVFHTPVNATYPGSYFQNFDGVREIGNGLIVFGPYTNASGGGASPVYLWYTKDYGETWQVFYNFGQTPNYRDDGTSNGSSSAGNLLGDETNPVYCRHVHGVEIGYDGNIYICTGDNKFEMHWFKCEYNDITDTWSVTDLLTSDGGQQWQRCRAIGIVENDGYIYWGSDGIKPNDIVDGIEYEGWGIYRAKIENLNDIAKHELLQELGDEAYVFKRLQDNVIICGLDESEGIKEVYVSRDSGNNWQSYDLVFDVFDSVAFNQTNFDNESNRLLVLNRLFYQVL